MQDEGYSLYSFDLERKGKRKQSYRNLEEGMKLVRKRKCHTS